VPVTRIVGAPECRGVSKRHRVPIELREIVVTTTLAELLTG